MYRLFLLIAFSTLSIGCAHPIKKSFPHGFALCEFEQSSKIKNVGSQLVFAVQNPQTKKWGTTETDIWTLSYVTPPIMYRDSFGADVIGGDSTLIIKKPVTIAFCNFKGGEIDVVFSTPPKQYKLLSSPPWKQNHCALRCAPTGKSPYALSKAASPTFKNTIE